MLKNICRTVVLVAILTACASTGPINADGSPNYAQVKAWAAHAKNPGASAARPVGALDRGKAKEVDVFYAHPTTFRDEKEWNQNLADIKTNAWTDASVVARQASVFNDCCNVYAPRYRAASFLASTDPTLKGRGGAAYDFAYADILRAFDYFLEHESQGRPFILAGHSQGGLMIERLLKDRIDQKPLQKKMVAAYVIGFNTPIGSFGRSYKTLKACAKPAQSGCVLSWNAMLDGGDPGPFMARARALYKEKFGTEEGAEMLCINPLTFDASQPSAGKSASKGAVPGDPGFGELRALEAGKVSARCEGGLLIVDVDPSLELEPVYGTVMHYHEFGMFYEDIRRNVLPRIENHFSHSERDLLTPQY